MRRDARLGMALLAALAAGGGAVRAEERPYGRGLTEANQQRLVIDDFRDISGWSNETPVETTLSPSSQRVKGGAHALKFGNVVDYTKGEKGYPIGWPRTAKNLVKAKLTDWSEYDFFEFWVYADTSRDALPSTPLSLGLTHPGHRVTSTFTLKEVRKDQWVKIVIPIAKLLNPQEVQAVRLNIAESNYRHGDRVDFYLCDMVLTRYVDPTVAELETDRKVLFGHDRWITAQLALMGHQGLDTVQVQLAVGPAGSTTPAAATQAAAVRRGELPLNLARPLPAGDYWARLRLRDAQGKLIDEKQTAFRVVEGPF